MAKIILNAALTGLSGTLDRLVFKHYRKDKRGMVLSRRPDMSRVKPSSAQLVRRELMRRAGEFHRQVLADPALLKKYQAIARKKRINLSAATMGEVLRRPSPKGSAASRLSRLIFCASCLPAIALATAGAFCGQSAFRHRLGFFSNV